MYEYEEPSIISWTRTANWSKLTLAILATMTLRVVPFHAYALLPTLLPFFKRILEVVLREGVPYRP
jgi:hypothetical protein